jgi:hypothetical protein
MFWRIETWSGYVLGAWNIYEPCHRKFNNGKEEKKHNMDKTYINEYIWDESLIEWSWNLNDGEFETLLCI